MKILIYSFARLYLLYRRLAAVRCDGGEQPAPPLDFAAILEELRSDRSADA